MKSHSVEQRITLSYLDLVLKVGLSYFQKNCFIYFTESLLQVMKNASYFILKAPFVLKIFKLLSWHFGHVAKLIHEQDQVNLKFMSQPG